MWINQVSVAQEDSFSPLPDLDWDYLHRLSDNCPEFELELLQTFLDDSPSHLEALKQAIASHNFQNIQRNAHHLKGASANIGALRIRAVAGKIEDQAVQQQLINLNVLAAQIEDSLQQIQKILASRL